MYPDLMLLGDFCLLKPCLAFKVDEGPVVNIPGFPVALLSQTQTLHSSCLLKTYEIE